MIKTKFFSAKRAAALALVLALVSALVPAFVFEASAANITINSAEDLVKLSSDCVNDTYSSGLSVVLGDDIDLSGVDFRPIPLFGGTFDGNGHKITGLKIDGAASYGGLFRQLLPKAQVKSLIVSGSVSGLDGARAIGGIAGINRGVISGCLFEGSVEGGESTGGVAGINAAEGVIEDCRAAGGVSGGRGSGGIAGENLGTIRGCSNSASVYARPEEAPLTSVLQTVGLENLLGGTSDAGGIAGTSSGTVRNCENLGQIGKIYSGDNVGGICGSSSGYIENCVNSGDVYGLKRVGGIVGRSCPDFRMTFQSGTAAELKNSIAAINSSVNSLVFTLALKGIAMSSNISGLMSSVTDVEQAAAEIIEDLKDFANGNIEAVNAISERVNETIGKLSPVLSAFAGAADGVSDSFSSLSGVLREAAAVSEITDSAFDRTSAAADASLRRSIQLASEALSAAQSAAGYLQDPDHDKLNALVEELKALLESARETVIFLRDSAVEIYEALYTLRDRGEHITAALLLAANISDGLSDASDAIANATRLTADLADDLSALGAVQFTLFKDNPEARQKLLGALEKINNHVISLSGSLGSLGLSDDLTKISDEVKKTADLIVDTFENITHPSLPQIDDVSETYKSDQSRRIGKITGCANNGKVAADSAVAGIAGSVSIPLEYDPSLEIDFYALFTGGSDITVYSLITGCSNDAAIEARTSYAGGIAGDASYGYIADCVSRGRVAAGESYAGGVAGRTRGTVFGCRANNDLDCPQYTGGVAGDAGTVKNSMALPFFTRPADFAGAIAGTAETASGNCYAECETGAVNGFTFASEAEALTYNELLVRSGADPVFIDVRIAFDFGDGTVSTVRIGRGSTLKELPAHAPDGDAEWIWNVSSDVRYYRDATVTGSYGRPGTAVVETDDGGLPEYIAEGDFPDGSALIIGETSLPKKLSRAVKAASVAVEGYEGTIRLHVRAEGNYKVYTFENGASPKRVKAEREGSYLIFDMPSGGSFALVKNNSRIIIIAVAAGVVLIAAGITAIIGARKRKSKKIAN